MINDSKINLSFRFVPMGTVAPEIIPENEIWLDVANRAAIQVFDHHFSKPKKLL